MSSSHSSFLSSHFETFEIAIETADPSKNVTIRGVRSKNTTLPGLLLLHGHPQTHHIWWKIAPALAEKYNVVAPDLRGHGESSKPAPADDIKHEAYSKRALARDQIMLMKALGHEKFYLVGHDRGGRVSHRLALDYPEAVIKILVLDIAPTLAMYEQADSEFASKYWHWFFLIQPAPMPEEFITASPLTYLKRSFLDKPSEVFSRTAIESYHGNVRDSACVHAMCEDYRASAPGGIDLTLDKEDMAAGKKIKAPFMVLWGAKGVVDAHFDCKKEWGLVCEGTVYGRSVPTGHFIPEEMDSKELVDEIVRFFEL